MFECDECNLRFEVVWENDGQGTPDLFCPRCSGCIEESSATMNIDTGFVVVDGRKYTNIGG